MEYSADAPYYVRDGYAMLCKILGLCKILDRYAHNLTLKLPVKVKSGTHLLSDEHELCQNLPINISEPVSEIILDLPARSLNTYIFMIDEGSTAIEEKPTVNRQWEDSKYYDLLGRRVYNPRGLVIEKNADGSSRIIMHDK